MSTKQENQTNYVYVVGSYQGEALHSVKIGRTNRPIARMGALKNGSPLPLEWLGL